MFLPLNINYDNKNEKFYKYISTLCKMKSFTQYQKICYILQYLLTNYLNIDEMNYIINDNESIYNKINHNIHIVCNLKYIDDFRELGKLVGVNMGCNCYI